jgi:hypothetical protein
MARCGTAIAAPTAQATGTSAALSRLGDQFGKMVVAAGCAVWIIEPDVWLTVMAGTPTPTP